MSFVTKLNFWQKKSYRINGQILLVFILIRSKDDTLIQRGTSFRECIVFELFVFARIFGKQLSLLSLVIHGLLRMELYTSDTWFCFSQCHSDWTRSNNFAQSKLCSPGIKTKTQNSVAFALSAIKSFKISSDRPF